MFILFSSFVHIIFAFEPVVIALTSLGFPSVVYWRLLWLMPIWYFSSIYLVCSINNNYLKNEHHNSAILISLLMIMLMVLGQSPVLKYKRAMMNGNAWIGKEQVLIPNKIRSILHKIESNCSDGAFVAAPIEIAAWVRGYKRECEPYVSRGI